MYRIRSKSGFSLIETLVSSGIIGIIAIAIGVFVYNTGRHVSYAKLKVDHGTLQSAVELSFRNSNTCVRNLSAINLVSAPQYFFSSLKDYKEDGTVAGTIVPSLSTAVLGNPKLKVSTMNVTGPNATGTPTLIAANTYLAEVIVTLDNSDPAANLRSISIPSLILKTNAGGGIVSCSSEQLGSSGTTCASLGMQWDAVNTVCVPSPARACSKIGGTWNAMTSQCELTPDITMTCPPGEAVNRFENGVPKCEPIVSGIWGPFPATCPAFCGTATITRTCLVGTCNGPATSTCTYYTPPTVNCGYTLVDRSGDPPGTCGGGGGEMIFCSATVCPPTGTRQIWSMTCDLRYL